MLQNRGKASMMLNVRAGHSNEQSINRGENQVLVGAIPFRGEYPCPRFEDKFRSANKMDGISIAGGGKMADS